jgi:hypothetical protein
MALALFVGGCGYFSSPAESPSGILTKYVAAAQKQDVPAMKTHLSKASLEILDKIAKSTKTTSDDLLLREASVQAQKLPETRNEKIEGDTATVEVKNETNGQFDMTLPFVKENGSWKIARDKLMNDQMKKALEENQKKLQ